MRGMIPGVLAIVVPIAMACSVRPARAADPVVEARADYDAAAAAYDRADYATAAVLFTRADERIPNPRALQLAMAAALLAADAGLAMNLVARSEERARTRAPDPAVTELAHKLRIRFEPKAGRIRVSCEGACRPSIDQEAVDPSRVRWVAPGRHVVTFETGAAPITREVVVRAGETIDVPFSPGIAPPSAGGPEAAPPPPEAATPAAKSTGLPPAFFWCGVAATGLAVGASTVLTVVVANRHDDFVERPSAATAEAGDAAQTRARIGWVVSGALLVTTVVLAVMADFGARGSDRAHAARPSSRLALGVGPLAASVGGTFW
jgi:hypothetical protein